MHRALQILELIEMICAHLPAKPFGHPDNSPQWTKSRGALAVLARTCKTFQEPALDALWSHQGNLFHIIACMPQDLWAGPLEPELLDTMDVIRPILPSDWERPLFYMSRVRSFETISWAPLPKGLLRTLALCMPTEHFFPNLRALSWNSKANDKLFPHIRLFLSPRIAKLEIRLSTTVWHLSFLPNLALSCPDLVDATIHSDSISADLRPHLRTSTSLFVCGLKRIETLHVKEIDNAAFQHLATVSSLTCLTVLTVNAFPSFPAPDLFHKSIFSSLQTIDVSTDTVHPAIAMTKALAESQLATIAIRIETATPEEISTLLNVFTQYLPHTSLRALDIDADHTPHKIYKSCVDREMVKSLECFANLEQVSIAFSGGLDLDDGVVLHIACAWPNLQYLSLKQNIVKSRRFVSRVTLAGLRDLAHHCPRLGGLTMEVNALVVPPRHPGTTRQSSLMVWDVCRSRISNARAVAEFLRDIFPKIKTEPPRFYDWDPRPDLWDEVDAVLDGRVK
ncbi:hypothetical protein B0H11DRAFT_1811961 [Mycena galericulata]|nr:hypothetical protein B0H11DRAFT_1811961 [Mycena galericulata]